MKTFSVKMKNNYGTIVVFISVVVALLLRFVCRNYESGDFIECLRPWVEQFRENGGWASLKHNVGDYNVVYQYILIMISYIEKIDCLYLIKFVSVIFDLILAWGCAACVKLGGGSKLKQQICFSLVLLMPTIWLNSAYWAQCDSIYVSLTVWSIYCLLKNKNKTSMMLLALAFAFKLQTVFIMPLYFVLFLKKKIRFSELFIFPLTFFVTYIPALAFGKPIGDIINIYVNQTKEYAGLTMNAPTLLQLFYAIEPNDLISKLSIIVAGIFAIFFVISAYKREYNMKMVWEYVLIFAIGIPFLLPHMHDRYFYFVDVFAIICLFLCSKKYAYVLALAEISSLICYLQYFDYVNRYFNKFWSLIFHNEKAALLMCVALVLTLVVVFTNTKINKKMIIAFFSSVACCLVILNVFSLSENSATIDGKKICFVSMRPIVEGDTVWYPLRNFSSTCGATVEYNPESRAIEIKNSERVILIFPGKDIARLNDNEVNIEPIRVINGNSYLTHDDFAKLFELTYQRDGRVIHYTK